MSQFIVQMLCNLITWAYQPSLLYYCTFEHWSCIIVQQSTQNRELFPNYKFYVLQMLTFKLKTVSYIFKVLAHEIYVLKTIIGGYIMLKMLYTYWYNYKRRGKACIFWWFNLNSVTVLSNMASPIVEFPFLN